MTVSFTEQGAGPAIVFLHGVGSGKDGWAHQIDCTVAAGFRFIAIDAPGFGETPLPQQVGFEPHEQAVLKVLDQLEISSAIICGHSLGGMTAQQLSANHPDRVSGLILSATSPAFGRPDGDFQKQFLKDRFEPFDKGMTMPEFARAFAQKLVGPSPREGAVAEIIEVMSQVSIPAYRLAMQTITGFDQRENLGRISVPALLISGDRDNNSPAPMMQKMASKISGVIYINLPDTGHMAPIENPDGFNHHLNEFLKQVGAT